MLFLDFEDSIAALEAELAELRHGGGNGEEESRLLARIARATETLYARLTPWQTVQVARHPQRPAAREVLRQISTSFVELHGDRAGGDDPLTVGGLARVNDTGVVLIGRDRPRPADPHQAEPYRDPSHGLRKTARLLRLAERFRLPAVIVADGEDGEAAAAPLHRCLDVAIDLKVPLIAVAIGEVVGPAAALYLAADELLMLEYACLSVATPEDAARAYWPEGDPARAAAAAAEALKLTAPALKESGIADAVIAEPSGGAHRDPQAACRAIAAAVLARLDAMRLSEGGLLRARRRDRLAAFGRAAPQP